jgi:hypothetical protein
MTLETSVEPGSRPRSVADLQQSLALSVFSDQMKVVMMMTAAMSLAVKMTAAQLGQMTAARLVQMTAAQLVQMTAALLVQMTAALLVQMTAALEEYQLPLLPKETALHSQLARAGWLAVEVTS